MKSQNDSNANSSLFVKALAQHVIISNYKVICNLFLSFILQRSQHLDYIALLNATVAQSKNCPFGFSTTTEFNLQEPCVLYIGRA